MTFITKLLKSLKNYVILKYKKKIKMKYICTSLLHMYVIYIA